MNDPIYKCRNKVYRRGNATRCNVPSEKVYCEGCQKARTEISEGILGIAKLMNENIPATRPLRRGDYFPPYREGSANMPIDPKKCTMCDNPAAKGSKICGKCQAGLSSDDDMY